MLSVRVVVAVFVLAQTFVLAVPDLTMSGPTTSAGVQPCGEECLCETPRKPLQPHTIAIGKTQITIGFGKTSLTPLCDVSTLVQMAMGEDSSQWVTVYNGPLSIATARALRSDEQIQFRIRERNCAGLSPYSDVLVARTLTDLAKPAPPTLVSATTKSICVTWNLTGLAVSDTFNMSCDVSVSYRVVGEDGALGPAWEPVEGYSNGTRVVTYTACATGLTSFTYYQFRVLLVDPSLPIPVSDAALFQTLAEVPVTPTKPIASDLTDSSVAISWSRIPSTTNRSPASLYLVECADAAAPANQSAISSNRTGAYGNLKFLRVAQTKKQSITVNGLNPGNPYVIRVISVNAVGQSPPSEALLFITKATVPTVVPGLNFTSVSSDSIRVDWNASLPNGSPITSYTLEMFGGVTKDYTAVYQGLVTHRRVDSLEPNVFYGFRVKTTNAIGSSAYSGQIFVKTPLPGQTLSADQLATASHPITSSVARQSLLQLADGTFHPMTLIDSTATNSEDDLAGGDDKETHFTVAHLQATVTQNNYSNPDVDADNLSATKSISGGDASDGTDQIQPPLSINGMCSVDRGDCLEKDSNENLKHFTCNSTISTVSVVPTLSSCVPFDLTKLVADGDSVSLGPALVNKLQLGCGCTCSGQDSSCGEAGLVRMFTGVSSGEECSQVICSFQKFASCSWQGVTVSQGTWQDDSLVFISQDLQSTCFQNTTVSLQTVQCPNGCGGYTNGHCLGNGKCRCTGDWTGVDCLTALCPQRKASCGKHGTCVAPNVCKCTTGYSGINCDQYDTLHFKSVLGPSDVNNWTQFIPAALSGLIWNETTLPSPQIAHKRKGAPPTPQQQLGSYIGIPYFQGLDFSANASFSVSLWFRATNQTINQEYSVMLSHGNFRHGGGWGMGMLRGGYLFCAIGSPHEPYRATDMAMPVTLQPFASGFHHLTCGYNGRQRQFQIMVDGNFVDIQVNWPYQGGVVSKSQGILDVSGLNLSPTAKNSPLVVGASSSMTTDFFNGDISEIRIWNVLRTAQQESVDMWAPLPESFDTIPMIPLVAYFGLSGCSQLKPVVSGVIGLPDHTHTNVQVLLSTSPAHSPLCVAEPHPLVVSDDSDLISFS